MTISNYQKAITIAEIVLGKPVDLELASEMIDTVQAIIEAETFEELNNALES